jgi:metal-responsive CopG/Arc/MetJ family transcriptional regulator
VRANITVDEALLRQIDHTAQTAGSTRSGFLAEAARAWLRNDQRKWVEERGRDLRRQLNLLRTGKMHTGETQAAGDVDTTEASIAQIEGWLAELPAILKAGE